MLTEERAWSMSWQMTGLVMMWALSMGLQTWSNTTGPEGAGRWAIMVAGAAAAWTAVFGVRKTLHRVAECLIDRIKVMHDEQIDDAVDPIVAELMRRIEIRELRDQVAQLIPSPRP